jgi:hypothetical protein
MNNGYLPCICAGYVGGMQCDVWRTPAATAAIPTTAPSYKVGMPHQMCCCFDCELLLLLRKHACCPASAGVAGKKPQWIRIVLSAADGALCHCCLPDHPVTELVWCSE